MHIRRGDRGALPPRSSLHDHAQGGSFRVAGIVLGNFEQGRGDAQSPTKLGNVASTLTYRSRALSPQLDERLNDVRDLGKRAEIVGIVEPVADEAAATSPSTSATTAFFQEKPPPLSRERARAELEHRLAGRASVLHM